MQEIYKYKNPDRKQLTNDLAVTFRFADDTELSDAEAYVMSLLVQVGKEVEYSFDMWTTREETD
jgi:hypothetical protein|tara:strand:+ start:3707 stop:3898 length:192 start_codon:yes stop_codon:yes gene_type:complete